MMQRPDTIIAVSTMVEAETGQMKACLLRSGWPVISISPLIKICLTSCRYDAHHNAVDDVSDETRLVYETAAHGRLALLVPSVLPQRSDLR